MEKIRKGNDIEVRWAIYAGEGINEAPYDLSQRNLSLYLVDNFGRKEVYDFTVERHVLTWVFYGKDQHRLGKYSLELVENEGREGMHTVDECDAFQLVKCSCEAGGDSEGRVECIHLQFRSNMGVSIPTLGSAISVDSQLSEASENPVQNKVITLALADERKRAIAEETMLSYAVEEIRQSVGTFLTKIDAIETRMTAVEEKTVLIEERIETLENKMLTVEEKVTAMDEKVLIMDAKVTTMDEKVTAMEEDATEVKTSISTIESTIDTLEEKIENIEAGTVPPEISDAVQENSEAIEILNADSETEGSIANTISSAYEWVEL